MIRLHEFVTDLDGQLEAVFGFLQRDHGLVDVKVCTVDEVWSGLKLVRRLKDRT